MNARQHTLTALFALCDAALLAPLVSFAVPLSFVQRSGAIAGLWVVVIGLALLWRWLARREVALRKQYVILGLVLGALTLLAEFQIWRESEGFAFNLIYLLPALIAAALLFWCGTSLGGADLNFTDAARRLQIGVLLFVVMGLMATFVRNNRLLDSILPFFCAAMFAMPLAHLESVNQSHVGLGVRMNRGWWSWSLAFTAIAVALGTVLYSVFSGTPIVVVVLGLLGLLAIPFVYLFSLLLDPLIRWLASRMQGIGALLPEPAPLPNEALQNAGSEPWAVPPVVGGALSVVVMLALAAFVLLLVGHAARSRERARREREQHDVDLPLPAAESALPGRVPTTQALRRWLAALTIRRLYARMTHEAGKRGHARLPAQTPHDFLPKLALAFPNRQAEARLITDAYIAAHYGEVPDSDEALRNLKAAWERMKVKVGR